MISKNQIKYVTALIDKPSAYAPVAVIELEVLRELRQQLKKVYGHLVIEKPQTEYEMGRSEMAKNIIRDLDELLCVEGEK